MVALEAVVSGIAYIIVALFMGTLVTASFVLPAEENVLRRTLFSSALVLLLAFLLIAVLSLVVQGAKLQGGNRPTLDILTRYLLRTQSGRIWLVRELYGAFLILVMLGFQRTTTSKRGALWLFFLSLPLIASRSLMSHAAAVKENTILVISADAIHLIVTALWAGGLPVLFWVLWRGTKRLGLPVTWAAQTVARFSRLALFSVGVLALTGLYQSWIHVQSLNALFATSYGRVLLLKLCLFLSMVGLGALNLLSTKPELFKAAQSNTRDLPLQKKSLRRIGAESILGFLVLSVTGVLTVLPPGIHSAHLNSPLRGSQGSTTNQPTEIRAPASERGKIGFLEKLGLLLMPSLAGLQPAEGAKVTILSPKEGQSLKGDEVPIRYEFVQGKRGQHLHAYVDGQLLGMFSDPESGTLTGLRPGRHKLELRVVANDRQTELDATDRVDFVVK